MHLKYSGAHFDPITSDNELSVKLALNAAEKITHSKIDGDDEFTNLVTAIIR